MTQSNWFKQALHAHVSTCMLLPPSRLQRTHLSSLNCSGVFPLNSMLPYNLQTVRSSCNQPPYAVTYRV